MSSIDMALLAFTTFNAIRVLAYFPQMAAIIRDTNGATAISYWTWGLFAGSHLSTVGYALVVIHDWKMAAVFGVNACCCLTIIVLTAQKRRAKRIQAAVVRHAVPAARPTAPDSIVGAGRAILGRLLEPTSCRTDSAAPERAFP